MNTFTRNKRRQILAMDLAECILYGIGKGGTRADKTCVARIRKQRQELVLSMFGTEKFLDDPDKQAVYSKAVKSCTDYIDKAFEDLGNKSNDAVWLNVLVYLFERVLETMPKKCKKQRQIMDRARGSAYTLYLHHEGSTEDEDAGVEIVDKLLLKIGRVA